MSLLDEAFKISEKVCEDSTVYAAMDIGSTQTRTCIFVKSGGTGTPILLDSNYQILIGDIDNVSSTSDSVVGNLEMVIDDLTEGKDKFVFKQSTHVLKGELLNNVTNARQITAASVSKVNQEATYINAVTNSALAVLDWYSHVGVIKGVPTVKLEIALPPEDTKHKETIKLFMSRLAGKYRVAFPRLGTAVTFNISEESNVIAEPEAVSVFLTAKKQITDEDEDSVICVLDIGGRSTGITFIDNKALLSDSCVTVPVGGARLLALLGKNIATEYNIQEPIPSRLIKALTTGKYKIGTKAIDISKCIANAKQAFANIIFSELLGAIDLNGIQMQNIAKVFCSGRTFTDVEGFVSLKDLLAEACKNTSEYTEFYKVEADTPILTGLLYHGIMYA